MKTKILFLLGCCMAVACTSSFDQSDQTALNPSFVEAKAHFESLNTPIAPPQFGGFLESSYACGDDDCSHTHHAHSLIRAHIDGNAKPLWSKAVYYQDSHTEIYEVPLSGLPTSASLLKGRSAETIKAQSMLVMQKRHTEDTWSFFVSTALGTDATETAFRYTGNRSAFSGYVVVSGVQGAIITGWGYEAGRQYSIQVANGSYHSNTHVTASIVYNMPMTRSSCEDCYKIGNTTILCNACWLKEGIPDKDSGLPDGEQPGGFGDDPPFCYECKRFHYGSCDPCASCGTFHTGECPPPPPPPSNEWWCFICNTNHTGNCPVLFPMNCDVCGESNCTIHPCAICGAIGCCSAVHGIY